jgi:hypothetical protein
VADRLSLGVDCEEEKLLIICNLDADNCENSDNKLRSSCNNGIWMQITMKIVIVSYDLAVIMVSV